MASKHLAGKIAIVTASTDGIGLAIARRLGNEGAKIIISSRKQPNVEKATDQLLKEGLEVKGLVCHVANGEHRQKLFEEAKKLGGIDILVSNAAVNPYFGGIMDCDIKMFDKIMDVNVRSAFLLSQEALPLMRQRPSGRIVFISTMAAYFTPEILGMYSFSKTCLNALTKAAAFQLAKENITVNCVCPGHIHTRFSAVLREDKEKEREELQRIPMHRFGTPEEMAGVVSFLVSDDASYITGENIVANGGLPTRL